MTPARGLAALVALLLLAACGGGNGAGAQGSRITVVLFGDANEVAGYRDLVDAFTEERPDVTVDLAPVASQDELLAKLTTSFAGGLPPDVFLINYRFFGQFAAEGAIEPAGPYLEGSDVLDAADFAQAPLDAFTFDGELACMPQNLSSLVVYYNQDLFAQAGLDPPADGWTWDDFGETAKTLTAGDVYGAGVAPLIIRVAPFVWSNGGELTDDPRQPTTLTLDDPRTREALDWFLDLQLVHGVVPPDAEELSEDSEARFLRGRLGMYLQSRVAVPTLRGIDDFDWDVAPLPVAPGGEPTSILHSDAYCMGTGGDSERAWSFVEFAMGRQGQEILAQSGRTVPSRVDVASSAVFLEPDQPPASAQVYLDAAPSLRSTPTNAAWARVEKEANSALAEVFYGRVGREDGLAQLVERTRPLFALDAGG